MDKKQVKVVFLGTPHAGKTTIVNYLTKLLPEDSFYRFKAHLDGDGGYSSNADQEQIRNVRVKYDYTESDLVNWAHKIENSILPITIVDLGGLLRDDKIPVLKACNYYIVIGTQDNDESIKKMVEWKSFAEKYNCQCFAIIHTSDKKESDKIFEDNGILHLEVNNICSLNKGIKSQALNTMADKLVLHSNYHEVNFSDPSVINIIVHAKKLGIATKLEESGGHRIEYIFDDAPNYYRYFSLLKCPDTSIKIFGIRPNWVAGIVSNALLNNQTFGKRTVSLFDISTQKFIELKRCTIGKTKENESLEFYQDSTSKEFFLHLERKVQDLSADILDDLVLPEIPNNKIVYISGALPLWLICSICLSYKDYEVYVFQPGNGFICVVNKNVDMLGKTIKEPSTININNIFKTIPQKRLLPNKE